MSDTAPPHSNSPISNGSPAQSTPAPRGILRRIPILGHILRGIDRDLNNIFWLVPVIILALVLSFLTWGFVALTMAGLVMVPLMFAFFIAISWP